MSKPFLGVGWAFPPGLDAQGFLSRAEYEESVRQSIWIILGTAKGERVMRPDFGCGIYDLVFEVNNASTAGKVAQTVRQALLLLEPRIQVLDVAVRPANSSEVLLIDIDYQVRATNTMFNLVYPFYLERSTA
ncbi:GPW/gp25 family protein [Accumulibacter sp.]|uniref:GPW/gp25 family protein n=1 Tax=Accumulibacter sp. TaxID=2053492 RepID=UPI0025CF7CD2|nr:GPW/gp25 family protein [Accumulibacter sp.]MCM8596519.1 GPW/gp25 family protein [Accumulibacter sp.]MCM8627309.1 GPW/gp25 family protein [Accumulibacter sp.]MDS4050668.1 GPW/gp25 family protein [Accumulibacter sp.]